MLEVGKKYLRVDGLVCKIVTYDRREKCYACDGSADGTGWWYNPDGKLCGFEYMDEPEHIVGEYHE